VAVEVRRADIEDELGRVLPAHGDVTQVHPLLKGHGHQSFVLETGSGVSVLLKIALRLDQAAKMRSLGHVLALAARHHVPAPRLLHFSEGSASFGGRPWLIQEFLPGDDGEVALAGMSEPERAAFFRDFGAAVARLHAIDVGHFSDDLAASARETTWAAAVESRLARLAGEHRHAALLPSGGLETAAAAIRSLAHAVSPGVRPALVHRDLYLPNTLVAAGRFHALLDFEHARPADALADFVKLRMWVFDVVPGSESEFCAGYGTNPWTTTQGRRRHHVSLGLELLSGLLYWKRTGQSEMLDDYQRRFGEWSASID
jgi:aminoglycoside phosphotransferase (APT) family kinase protein